MTLWQEVGARRDLAGALADFATFAQAHGLPERATRLFAAGERHRLATGEGRRDEDEEAIARGIRGLRESLSEEAFAASWIAGQTMTLEQAIAYALDEGETI